MFFLSYISAELRRRKGRTLLTALGLAVGVALVVTVSALSSGLDDAQDEVLEPLTGVGTDMSVSRPLEVSEPDGGGGGPQFVGPGGGGLSDEERKQLEEENGPARIGLANRGKPGERFEDDNLISATQLSFPESEVRRAASIDGVKAVAGSLRLTSLHVSGKLPEEGEAVMGRAPTPSAGPPRNIDVDPRTVSGMDLSEPSLAEVTPSDVTKGEWLEPGRREVVLNEAYAKRKSLDVGDSVKIKDEKFEIVGLSRSPLGGDASDIYMELAQLQKLSGREGRINSLNVRAESSGDVAAVERAIEGTFDGAKVTTAKDLADRVGGSLSDARDLSGKLGTALQLVGLLGAFLLASLLTLSSVSKRVRELGTLKALGWRRSRVVRQITGESLAQGLVGGALGIAIAFGAVALIDAIGPTLEASVAAAPRGPGPFGQGSVTSGSTSVQLDAGLDLRLLAMAIGLALLGGLVAGTAGGLRAARLRPAVALRNVE